MGRYTTVQTFADNNQRVAALPYEKASGGVKADPDSRAPGVRVPVVQNVSGSTAGAGSSHFHVYRLERRREEERLKNMDESHEAMLANQEYHARLEANRLECEARTQKRAEKRKRGKLAKGLKKRETSALTGVPVAGGDEDVEEAEETGDVGSAVSASAGTPLDSVEGDDLFADDGRFLERFLMKKQGVGAEPASASLGPAAGASAADPASSSVPANDLAAATSDAAAVAASKETPSS